MAQKTVKYQGQIYTIEWNDPSRNPTKEEFLDLIKVQSPEPIKSGGFFSGLGEGIKGLYDFGKDVQTATAIPFPFSRQGLEEKVGAGKRVFEGAIAGPVKAAWDAYQRNEELEKQFNLSQIPRLYTEAAKNQAGLAAELSGLTPAIESLQEGRYAEAGGRATIPVVGAIAGGVKPVGRLAKPAASAMRKADIAPFPFGPEPPPRVPGSLETPQPIVTTPENLIAGAPLEGQVNPQRADLRYGLRRQVGETATEYKQRIAEQIEAVEAADIAGQRVKRPVVQPKPIGPAYNPLQENVPERLREPGMNQVVFEALLGTDPTLLGGRSKYARKAASTDEAVAQAVSKIDEAVPVAPEQAAIITNKLKSESWFKDIYDRLGTSVSTQLWRNSPQLAQLVHKTRTEGNRLGGHYAAQIRKVARKLTPEQNLLAFRILDGAAQVDDLTPSSVKFAVSKIRSITEELGALGEQTGIHIKTGEGESVPFVRRKDYAPHIYGSDFLKKNEGTIIQKLIDEGKTPEQARQLLDRSRRFGERYISPQHAREFNAPGYIEDLSSFEKYAYDMAERVTQAKAFGVKDVADATSPVSQLIKSSANPEKVGRVMTEYFDRGVKAHESHHKGAQALVNFEVLSHLSLSAINQLSDLAGVPVRTGAKNFAKGLYHTMTRYMDATDLATESGALVIMKREILKDAAQSKFGNFYGLSKMEEVVRTVSASSGRAAIQDLFNKLKTNPNHKGRRAEFARLIDEDIDAVLRQPELSKEQINFGAGRTVELINSIPDKLDLPPAFTHHNPLVRIPLLFKRYAFTTTKNLAQAIQQDPKRIIPALLSYGLIGEMTGDVKEVIKQASSGNFDDILKAVSKRDEKAPFDLGHPMLNRAQANLMQSWFMGMMGDMAEAASRGSRGFYGFAGGPVIGDIGELADVGKAAVGGNVRPLTRSVLRRVPFLGSGLAELVPKGNQESQFK